MLTLAFGSLTQEISSFFAGNGPSPEQFQQTIDHNTLYFVYLRISIMVCNSIDTFIHVYRGEMLDARIRTHYLAGVLRQNVAYFDKLHPGEVTTRSFAPDMEKPSKAAVNISRILDVTSEIDIWSTEGENFWMRMRLKETLNLSMFNLDTQLDRMFQFCED